MTIVCLWQIKKTGSSFKSFRPTSYFGLMIITVLLCICCCLLSGLVTIESPGTTVCYQSSPVLKCTFEEATGSAGWNMTSMNESFELNNGSVVQLTYSCSTENYKSCVAVTLRRVTGIWAGKYRNLTLWLPELKFRLLFAKISSMFWLVFTYCSYQLLYDTRNLTGAICQQVLGRHLVPSMNWAPSFLWLY